MRPVADAKPISIDDTTETAGRSVTQPPVIINFLTRDEQYVFSTFEVHDEETAEREAAAALEQGVPSYYLVPTGDRYRPWRRIDVGLSEEAPRPLQDRSPRPSRSSATPEKETRRNDR